MNSDEFDDSLRRALDEPPLPDREFTREVMTRVARARRRRRLLFAIAAAVAGVVIAVAMRMTANAPSAEISPGTVLAALVLIAISSFAWIEGEATVRFRHHNSSRNGA